MVDEVEYSGVLDVIMICVCFVLMMNDMYECWEKSWYWQMIGVIVCIIVVCYGFMVVVDVMFVVMWIDYVDQM